MSLLKLNQTNNDGRDACPIMVPFDDTAQDLLQSFRVQCREWEKEAFGTYKSHIGKLRGLAIRVACVLTFLEWAATPFGVEPNEIGAECMKKSIYLVGDYLRLHAYRAHGTAACAPEIRKARQLAKLIAAEMPTSLTTRELQRRNLADLKTSEDIRTALRVLERFGWLKQVQEPTPGRTAELWPINPLVAQAIEQLSHEKLVPADNSTEADTRPARPLLSPSVDLSMKNLRAGRMPGLHYKN